MDVKVDEAKRRKHGPDPLSAEEKRGHTVSVRLNVAELSRLDDARSPLQMQRGEYLRAAAFQQLPRPIPEINRQAWGELARLSANLNQLTRHANAAPLALDLEATRQALADLRRKLIGVVENEG